MRCAGRWSRPRARWPMPRPSRTNTVIRAPVTGTILERAVEKGEFVTTMNVGDKGAKGYVVALADLNDLEVELDISQNDFAKLHPNQKGIVTTDAFPRPQVRRLHQRDLARGQSPEGDRADQSEGPESGRLPAAGHECQRGVPVRREAGCRRERRRGPIVVIPASASARQRGLRDVRRKSRPPRREDRLDQQPGRAHRRRTERRRGLDRQSAGAA